MNSSLQKLQTIPSLHEQSEEGPWSKELIHAIAADIGKDTAAYIEVMYPKAVEATSSTFKLSVRNHIRNQVMGAIKLRDAESVEAWLAARKKHRREWLASYRRFRAMDKFAEPTDDATKLRELAEKIKLRERGWSPDVGYVKNITFTIDEAATIERALNFFADMEVTAINPSEAA